MLSLMQITEAIEQTSEQLEELVDQITAAGDEAAHAEAAFKAEFAKARLSARHVAEYEDRKKPITADEVEDHATVATETARLRSLLATNNLLVLREARQAQQARLDALRSLSASYRSAGG